MADNILSIGSDRMLPSGVVLEEVDPLSEADWDSEVLSHPSHSVFHRSAWAKVLAGTYGHRPVYLKLVSSTGDRAWIPLMEVCSPISGRRGVSLPFSDFAGPLWSGNVNSEEVFRAIFLVAAERRWRHFDIRHSEKPPNGAQPFKSYEGHVLDLTVGEDGIEAGLEPSVRRAIRKAARSGLEISIDSGCHAVTAFYALHCETRRRHGLPPQPFRFFESIQRHLLECGMGEVVLASLKGKAVAGAVFLRSAGRAIYKFGASGTAHWDLRPNQWVMWHGIRHLVAQGCGELHFGRTSHDEDGLSRFKRSWGCRTETLDYFRHGTRADRWLAGARSSPEGHPLVFGRMPLAINRLAGRLIYPHLD
jgi:hypothetical protein